MDLGFEKASENELAATLTIASRDGGSFPSTDG